MKNFDISNGHLNPQRRDIGGGSNFIIRMITFLLVMIVVVVIIIIAMVTRTIVTIRNYSDGNKVR